MRRNLNTTVARALIILALATSGCVTLQVGPTDHGSEKPPAHDRGHGRDAPSCLVGKPAPDFTADAVMPDNTLGQVTLSNYRGQYVILFFYPLDFTFVCPTEIIEFDARLAELKQLNCQVLGVSVDSKYTHLAWKSTPQDDGGIGNIQYPLVADLTKEIARSYGVLSDDAFALRGLFLIDKKGIVRHALINAPAIGRNVDEAVRVLKAVQFVDEHQDVCPVNWQPGERTLTPTAEGVKDYLRKRGQ